MDSTKMNKQRNGWATVPSLLMLAVIASITAGMANVSWTNVRSAQAIIAIAKAQSAAESGLSFGGIRLLDEVNRYVIDRGVIDSDLAQKLWEGTWTPIDGFITVLPADDYVVAAPSGTGIVHSLQDVFEQVDAHWFEAEGEDALLPAIDPVSFALEVKPIALDSTEDSFFRLTYTLIENDTRILVTSVGVADGVSRKLSMEFDLDKRIDYALVAMSRVMLGRNVIVEGPIGTRYGISGGELDANFGTPFVMRSDFYGLDPGTLDGTVSAFAALVLANDVDGDNRLRPSHPTEGIGLGGALQDYDGNQYISEMDLFLSRFDSNGDIAVVYDPAQALYAGHPGMSQEFSGDMQLAMLIDNARSDRNGDGVTDSLDRELGWDDGIIDGKDHYAKVDGSIGFAVSIADWEAATGQQWQASSALLGCIDQCFSQALGRTHQLLALRLLQEHQVQ